MSLAILGAHRRLCCAPLASLRRISRAAPLSSSAATVQLINSPDSLQTQISLPLAGPQRPTTVFRYFADEKLRHVADSVRQEDFKQFKSVSFQKKDGSLLDPESATVADLLKSDVAIVVNKKDKFDLDRSAVSGTIAAVHAP